MAGANDVQFEPAHVPVLAREVVSLLLDPDPAGGPAREPRRFVDATVGGGGHADALLGALEADGAPMAEVLYLGIDRDRETLARAAAAIDPRGARVELVHGRMSELQALATAHGVSAADGILLDLGVSSFQLDDPGRGFTFREDVPLDMRMDPDRDVVTARDLVNQLDAATLESILRHFGEERNARRIAENIVEARGEAPISTTRQLTSIVARSFPAKARHGRTHVATRTFQALRMAVNQEQEQLTAALEQAQGILAPRGRLAIISFHSLEDRPVKQAFRAAAAAGEMRDLTRKVIKPSDEEVARNPRARSAKLRCIERRSPEGAAA